MLNLRKLVFIGCLSAAVALSGCASRSHAVDQPQSASFFIFDTIVTVKIYDDRADERHFTEIEAMLGEIDARLNRNLQTSEIAHVNAMAGIEPVPVTEDTFHLVERALQIAELSNGRFDPTIGPLVDLWGIGGESPQAPADTAVREAAQLVDFRKVRLDRDGLTLYLTHNGMSLDLGAIAKGYAADRIASYLDAQNLPSAIIDLGGNILATGLKPDGSLWTIGVQDPDEARGAAVGTLKVSGKSIVSSGVYERFFIEDGIRYHHILDPGTGYPIHNGLLSVTIVSQSSTDADALSTAVFSLGLDEGMAFVQSMAGVEAVFITEDKQVIVSDGLRDELTLTASDYTH